MTPAQLETWVIATIDRVRNRLRVEDSRIELKAQFPESADAARRIAGHLNAARGDSVLWIIGIDEKTGQLTSPNSDHATWWQRVLPLFDGVAPGVMDLRVPYDGGRVIALLFDGARVPFVVRNPQFGQKGAGPVALEVPWRENTTVRSATRSDLLRLLTPALRAPQIEILDGKLELRAQVEYGGNLYLLVQLYLTPAQGEQLTRASEMLWWENLGGTDPSR